MVEKWLYRGGVKSNCTCEQNITKKFVELHPISKLKKKRLEIVRIDPTPNSTPRVQLSICRTETPILTNATLRKLEKKQKCARVCCCPEVTSRQRTERRRSLLICTCLSSCSILWKSPVVRMPQVSSSHDYCTCNPFVVPLLLTLGWTLSW